MRSDLLLGCWLAALLTACAPGLELAVDVRTDLVPGVEFDRVAVSLDGALAEERPVESAGDFRRGVRAAEFRGLGRGRHQVTVQLVRRDLPVLTRRVALRIEGSVILPVVLTRDCRGVTCPGSGSVTDSECLGGACIDPGCSPLDPASCPSAQCGSDAECTSATACVEPRCLDGVCLEVARNGACGSGQVCVPGEGCVDTGSLDAGSLDAGPLDAGSPDAGPIDAGTGAMQGPPSCAMPGLGRTDCDPSGTVSCCESPLVTGGTFDRSYDGVSMGYTSRAYPATVSDFRLDAFEVTVGRFRSFVAWVAIGVPPAPGAGRHTHLNGGAGLRDPGPPGGDEQGWQADWTVTYLPTTKAAWDAALVCDTTLATWTADPGANERLAINCVNWYAAQAFCLWDGGFLPSEAEWNYAASGGSEQRVYPWSSPPGEAGIVDATYAVHGAPGVSAVGLTLGLGRYGQYDLAGNVNDDARSVTGRSQVARASRVAIAPTFGAGLNFYINRFLSFNIEYRATPFQWNRSGTDENSTVTSCGSAGNEACTGFSDYVSTYFSRTTRVPRQTVIDSNDRSWSFNQMVTFGLTIYLPTAPRIGP